ncbi:MAG: alpha-amylase [Anaerolineaceae bacterium]|nr:alpha-amylase [Anaerolineaceae bacterium]
MLKPFKLIVFCVCGFLIFSACVPSSQPAQSEPTPSIIATIVPTPTPYDPMPRGSEGYPWWNDTVFYEVFLRSFYDSNGDGIGDINGLIEKLDYLNDGDPNTKTDLGITGIWLMPIFPSPSYHGYDVTNYYEINPDYGTMDDFNRLLEEAHSRGIRIVIDFVINHTSTEHPWFIEARKGEDSLYRNWYLWSEQKPEYLGPWGQPVWHANYDQTYFYGVFWSGMPDLNYENQEVTGEINRIASFWLDDIGVDGFRVDGARHLIEDGDIQENSEATHTWFQNFYTFYKGIDSQAITIGEIWDSNFSAVKYVKNNEFDLVFDFELAESLMEGINGYDGRKIQNALDFNTNLYPNLQKANFLTNHDMNRVMHVFQQDVTKAKMAAVLLLTSPGVPFIYYGEEIGMMGSKPDENIRRPMQWNGEENAGFTTGYPWESLNQNYEDLNVDNQLRDPESLLSLYRELINMRNHHTAFRVGNYFPIESKEVGVVSFLRQSQEEMVLLIVNPTKETKEILLKDKSNSLNPGTYLINSILSSNNLPSQEIQISSGEYFSPVEQLEAGEFLILELVQQ